MNAARLRNLPQFRTLPPEELEQIAARIRPRGITVNLPPLFGKASEVTVTDTNGRPLVLPQDGELFSDELGTLWFADGQKVLTWLPATAVLSVCLTNPHMRARR